jgi:hypothetical protein
MNDDDQKAGKSPNKRERNKEIVQKIKNKGEKEQESKEPLPSEIAEALEEVPHEYRKTISMALSIHR